MRPHQNLDLWKKSIELAVSIYRQTEKFPKEERFSLTQQLRPGSRFDCLKHCRRSSTSVYKGVQKVLNVFPRISERS